MKIGKSNRRRLRAHAAWTRHYIKQLRTIHDIHFYVQEFFLLTMTKKLLPRRSDGHTRSKTRNIFLMQLSRLGVIRALPCLVVGQSNTLASYWQTSVRNNNKIVLSFAVNILNYTDSKILMLNRASLRFYYEHFCIRNEWQTQVLNCKQAGERSMRGSTSRTKIKTCFIQTQQSRHLFFKQYYF